MPSIVVIGAGYAGVHAARAAARAGGDVTLLDDDGRHDLLPRLAQVASATAPVGDAWADADDLVPGIRFVRGRAESIDVEARLVRTETGTELAYDALVVTTGARSVVPDARGLPLRTASDALRLRHEIADADRLVVVGGGATGVQLAGGAKAGRPDLDVHVVERERRLLPGFSRSLSWHARRILRHRGVHLHLGTDASVTDGGVTLADGRSLDGLVVWAAGYRADGNTLLPDAPTIDGRLAVDRHLRVPGAPRILAAGDIADHRDLMGNALEMSAQIAVQAGKAAGANAVRIATGRRPRPARLLDVGWVLDLGGGQGVAQVGPVRLDAPFVDRLIPLLHGAVDIRHLLQTGGLDAVVAYAPGRHHPDDAAIRRTERPALRSAS